MYMYIYIYLIYSSLCTVYCYFNILFTCEKTIHVFIIHPILRDFKQCKHEVGRELRGTDILTGASYGLTNN